MGIFTNYIQLCFKIIKKLSSIHTAQKIKWKPLFFVQYNKVLSEYCTLIHLFPMHPFSTPWKHQRTVFWWFQGVKKGSIGNKRVKLQKNSKKTYTQHVILLNIFPTNFHWQNPKISGFLGFLSKGIEKKNVDLKWVKNV